MTPEAKLQALSQSNLSEELDPEERSVLVQAMGIQALQDEETLVTQGDARRTLFVLGSGSIDVCRARPAGEETIHEMQLGECAGTRAFVDGSPRQATLRARAASEVLTLDLDDFEALLDTHPRLVYKVMRAIFRITHTNLMRMNQESSQLQDYLLRTGNRH